MFRSTKRCPTGLHSECLRQRLQRPCPDLGRAPKGSVAQRMAWQISRPCCPSGASALWTSTVRDILAKSLLRKVLTCRLGTDFRMGMFLHPSSTETRAFCIGGRLQDEWTHSQPRGWLEDSYRRRPNSGRSCRYWGLPGVTRWSGGIGGGTKDYKISVGNNLDGNSDNNIFLIYRTTTW